MYDQLVAKIKAVLEHRRTLVGSRTLMLHYAADQIVKLPTDIRDQLSAKGKIDSRLRRFETVDTAQVSTVAANAGCPGSYPSSTKTGRHEPRSVDLSVSSMSSSTSMAPRCVTNTVSTQSPRPHS